MDTAEKIATGSFESIEFRGEVQEGHLVLDGLLADQAGIDAIPVGIYVMEKDGTLVACNETADVICEQPDGTRLLALVNVFRSRTTRTRSSVR